MTWKRSGYSTWRYFHIFTSIRRYSIIIINIGQMLQQHYLGNCLFRSRQSALWGGGQTTMDTSWRGHFTRRTNHHGHQLKGALHSERGRTNHHGHQWKQEIAHCSRSYCPVHSSSFADQDLQKSNQHRIHVLLHNNNANIPKDSSIQGGIETHYHSLVKINDLVYLPNATTTLISFAETLLVPHVTVHW